MFLSDEKERREYVMKEDGTIFNGSWKQIESLDWDFGQVKHIDFHSQPILFIRQTKNVGMT